MARDDQDSKRHDLGFVDRDDDSVGDEYVDGDYEDGFPPMGDSGDDEQDPGYAAFAAELEDPLADWPSPEKDLDDLPEMRRRRDGAVSGPAVDADDHDDWRPEDDDAPAGRDDDDPDDDFDSWKPLDERAILAADAGADGDSGPGPSTPQRSDRDEDFSSVTGTPADADTAAPAVPTPAATAYDLPEPPLASIELPDPPAAQQSAIEDKAGDTTADIDDDEFVDDFLNDLDDPQDAFPKDTAMDQDIDDDIDDGFDEGMSGDRDDALMDEALFAEPDSEPDDDAFAPEQPSQRFEKAMSAASAALVSQQRDGRPADSGGAGDRGSARGQEPERVLPWAMIAVVALALVLLAAGGYGVIQQRSGLEAQIRELQARLATAVSPEEAAAERERQRQLELDNESLAAELEALQAENSALAEEIAGLETQLSERGAAAEAAAAAAAEKAERAAAAQAERAAARSSPAASDAGATGPWFVNFGSYAQRDVADRWAGKISAGEGKVVVQSATAAGKSLYRVRVVGLASRDSAERVATALERQYKLPRLWVGRESP